MNWKQTWTLLAAAALLTVYVLIFERPSPGPADKGSTDALLFPDFDASRVTGIEITRTNEAVRANVFVKAQKENDRWGLANPAYPALQAAIENFLDALSKMRQHTEIPPEDFLGQSNAFAAYGLSPPRASVSIQYGTNRISFRLGLNTLQGDRIYMQRIGGPAVQVVDTTLFQQLPASAADWRQPTLLPMEGIKFDRLTVTNGPRVLELSLDPTNRAWNLVRPMTGKADLNQVLALAQQLQVARVSKFVSDDPRGDLDSYGLLAPEVSLALGRGTNNIFQIQFGRSPTNDASQVYAYLANYGVVALVPAGLAEFLRKPHTDFRDKTLLSFAPGEVDRIEAQTQGTGWAARREGTNAWKIVAPFQAPADTALVEQFLASLARLQVERFEKDVVTDFAAYGLAQPARQYALLSATTNAAGATNRVLAQVDLSAPRGDVVFARRTNEFGVYATLYSGTFGLPRAAYELRDRQLWSIAPSNIVGVAISQRGAARELRRQPGGAWTSDPVLNEAIEETVSRLGSLRALEWANKGEAQLTSLNFPKIDYRVALEAVSGGRTNRHVISFGALLARKYVYAATTLEEGEPVIFRFPIDLFGNVSNYLSIPQPGEEGK